MASRSRPRPAEPLLIDPVTLTDAFASGFEVQDFEDWLRLVCWADYTHSGGDGVRGERRKSASIVIPRSAIFALMEALRDSVGHTKDARPG